jgi:SAM-dependent methyltransferase
VIKDRFPNYRELIIHETSPGNRGASIKLAHECRNYSSSQFFKNIESGLLHPSGIRCENIENLSFDDASIDLFISQDVMEHVFDPAKAFKEIARILKPGGSHIFTVPLVNKWRPTERWASLSDDGKIVYHGTPEYHGNPVDSEGALVTMHWGYDITNYISKHAAMTTIIVEIDDISQGIRAEFIDVLVSSR